MKFCNDAIPYFILKIHQNFIETLMKFLFFQHLECGITLRKTLMPSHDDAMPSSWHHDKNQKFIHMMKCIICFVNGQIPNQKNIKILEKH